MAYTQQEKKDFAFKDAKYSIGMSRGNSLAKAVDLIIGILPTKKYAGECKVDELINDIFTVADKFHHFNQVSIEKDFAEWKSLNEERLNTELGIVPDFEKTIIQEGVKL